MRATASRAEAMRVRGSHFAWGERTYLMGIVNVTPDSFSGDGRVDTAAAVAHALAQRDAGADIVDIGAESTRPGATPVDALEEARRLLPVVRGVRAADATLPLSIDTFKPAVFTAAHAAGGDVLNTVWGLDEPLLAAAIAADAPVVIMHNQGTAHYDGDVVDEVCRVLAREAARALAAGLARERIVVDPGIGFGKTAAHNLRILGSLDRIVALGFPTLIGTSRKSTIGAITGKAAPDRVFGTAATVALAVAAKIDIVRVHDVAAMRDVVRVADAIVRGTP